MTYFTSLPIELNILIYSRLPYDDIQNTVNIFSTTNSDDFWKELIVFKFPDIVKPIIEICLEESQYEYIYRSFVLYIECINRFRNSDVINFPRFTDIIKIYSKIRYVPSIYDAVAILYMFDKYNNIYISISRILNRYKVYVAMDLIYITIKGEQFSKTINDYLNYSVVEYLDNSIVDLIARHTFVPFHMIMLRNTHSLSDDEIKTVKKILVLYKQYHTSLCKIYFEKVKIENINLYQNIMADPSLNLYE